MKENVKIVLLKIEKKNFYDVDFVVFDDMVECNKRAIEPFFTRGHHEVLSVYFWSQSILDSPKRTVRKNSNKSSLFKDYLKVLEEIKRKDGFEMSFDEFNGLCTES